jgi:uncharacterized glyoxalase superfamily protein PhnB
VLVVVPSVAAAIDYHLQALGARETGRQTEPDGRISRAEDPFGHNWLLTKHAAG